MKPPPIQEAKCSNSNKPKFVFPTLKETKLLDLAEVEEGIYTNEDVQQLMSVTARDPGSSSAGTNLNSQSYTPSSAKLSGLGISVIRVCFEITRPY